MQNKVEWDYTEVVCIKVCVQQSRRRRGGDWGRTDGHCVSGGRTPLAIHNSTLAIHYTQYYTRLAIHKFTILPLLYSRYTPYLYSTILPALYTIPYYTLLLLYTSTLLYSPCCTVHPLCYTRVHNSTILYSCCTAHSPRFTLNGNVQTASLVSLHTQISNPTEYWMCNNFFHADNPVLLFWGCYLLTECWC